MAHPSLGSLSDQGLFQNSYYVGITLQNILYGTELVFYFKTIQILVTRNKAARKKSDIFYVLFSSMMVFLITVWVATSAMFGQEMWLLHADYPGGSSAYWDNDIANWYTDWAVTSVIILQLMTDGLMIYRCHTIWNCYRLIVIPVIMWLSTLTLGIFMNWAANSPGNNLFTGLASQFGLAYCTVAVLLNTTLTCLICYWLLRYGKRAREDLGDEYASPYFAVVMIMVESVIPYTLSGIAFLVPFGMRNPTSVAFAGVYFPMMCISPQVLILRLMTGKAWDKDASGSPISRFKFNPERTSRSQWSDSNAMGLREHLQALSNVHALNGHESKVLISPA